MKQTYTRNSTCLTVVVFLKVNEELGTLEVAGSNPDIVISFRMIELCKTPIDEPQLRRLINQKYPGNIQVLHTFRSS